MRMFLRTLSIVVVMSCVACSAGSLRVPGIFSHNMVLQRDRPVPVWGTAAPGATVTVHLDSAVSSVKANARGSWTARLPARTAGGPFVLTIIAFSDTTTFRNVMIGDVWFCSGQSNMEMGVGNLTDAQNVIDSANYPDIRLFTVGKVSREKPADTVAGTWLTCTPANIRLGAWNGFSATAYFFGRSIYQTQHIPIGLVHASWGGSPAESWIPLSSLKSDPRLNPYVGTYKKIIAEYPSLEKRYREQMAAWDSVAAARVSPTMLADSGNRGVDSGWASASFTDAKWPTMDLPRYIEPLLPIDGAVWFRRVVEIPATAAGKELILSLGVIDDMDVTYFNGERIGATGAETPNFWTVPRSYSIPASIVKKGRAVIAVRLFDQFGAGGFGGTARQMFLSPPSGRSIPLAGAWRYRIERGVDPLVRNPHQRPDAPVSPDGLALPSGLYNGMIAPLTRMPIRGTIWYQGESNTNRPEDYETLLTTLIGSWRTAWGFRFPFLIVQLANYMASPTVPTESGWASVRAAQAAVAAIVPDCGLASAVDIGDAWDIHPKNKQEVGRRLALAARAIVYKESVVALGPRFSSVEFKADEARVSWADVGGGLVVRGDTLRQFALSGADRRFYWADARIDGATVVVKSSRVPSPVAVRYAWSDNPAGCNLFNKDGLPAIPFRTDTWDASLGGR